MIPASRPDACQPPAVPPEPTAPVENYADRDGDSIVNRRTVMNFMVSTAIAGAALAPYPTATAAAPAATDRRALEAYASWLFMERRILCGELWPHMGDKAERFNWFDNAGADWHFRGDGDWRDLPQPSTRAAAVLDLVGIDWRQPKRDMGINHNDSGERPDLPPNWPHVDGELCRALEDLVAIDFAIDRLHKAFGDDADSRDDYRDLSEKRNDCIATLIEVPASSMVGIQAKAAALRLDRMFEDFEQHQQIAVSLADDLAGLGPTAMSLLATSATPA
jgi:hypothetical protein